MFTFVTILTGTNLDIQSTSYIDNRAFPGSGRFPPGPLGYLLLVYAKPKNITPTLMFLLNNLLADGILVGSVSNLAAHMSNVGHHLVVSLLRHLLRKLLGHRPPLLVVPWLFWYVLGIVRLSLRP